MDTTQRSLIFSQAKAFSMSSFLSKMMSGNKSLEYNYYFKHSNCIKEDMEFKCQYWKVCNGIDFMDKCPLNEW